MVAGALEVVGGLEVAGALDVVAGAVVLGAVVAGALLGVDWLQAANNKELTSRTATIRGNNLFIIIISFRIKYSLLIY